MGCPVQPEGNLILSNAEIVGATSVIGWYCTVDPLRMPLPKKSIGTCVSYFHGEPWVVPVVLDDGYQPGSRTRTISPQRFGW